MAKHSTRKSLLSFVELVASQIATWASSADNLGLKRKTSRYYSNAIELQMKHFDSYDINA